jgi:hypothetical protein
LEGPVTKLSLQNEKQDKTRTYEMNPQIIADVASLAMVLPCVGARALSTPIWIPSDPRFANPQREYDAIVKARCDRGFALSWMLCSSAIIQYQSHSYLIMP